MTKEQAIEWLDKQVEANKVLKSKLEDIRRLDCPINYKLGCNYLPIMHIEGVAKLAEIIGVDYEEERIDGDSYPIKRWFIYKGYAVFEQMEDCKG